MVIFTKKVKVCGIYNALLSKNKSFRNKNLNWVTRFRPNWFFRTILRIIITFFCYTFKKLYLTIDWHSSLSSWGYIYKKNLNEYIYVSLCFLKTNRLELEHFDSTRINLIGQSLDLMEWGVHVLITVCSKWLYSVN